MSKFEVSYETTNKPASYMLPVGAKVTKVSSLPVHLYPTYASNLGRDLAVAKASVGGPDTVAFISVDCQPGVWLSKSEAQQVVDGLQELIDSTVKKDEVKTPFKRFDKPVGRYGTKVNMQFDRSALDSKAAFFYIRQGDRTISEFMTPEDARELYETLKAIVGD